MKEALKFRELVGHKFWKAFCSCKKRAKGSDKMQTQLTPGVASLRQNALIPQSIQDALLVLLQLNPWHLTHTCVKKLAEQLVVWNSQSVQIYFYIPLLIVESNSSLVFGTFGGGPIFVQTPNHNNGAKFVE